MNDVLDHLRTDIDYAANQLAHACALYPDQAEDRMRRALDALERCQAFLQHLDKALFAIIESELKRKDGRAFTPPAPEIDKEPMSDVRRRKGLFEDPGPY